MRSRKIFVGVVLGVVLCSFLFITVGNILPKRGSSDTKGDSKCVAVVKKRCVSLPEYRAEYYNEIAYLEGIFGSKLSDEQIEQLNIKQNALESLISRVVLAEFANDLGLKTNPKSVLDLVKNISAFQDENGVFDKKKFQDTLDGYGTSEESYLKKIQDSLPSLILSRSIFPDSSESHFKHYKLLAKDVLSGMTQYRVADIVEINSTAVGNLSEEPTEVELKAMYDKEDGIAFPEYRSVKYIAVTEEDSLEEATVSEEEVEYEIKNSELDDQRDVLNLVFSGEDEANEAYKAFVAGKTFESLVKDAGFTMDDIRLNNITRSILPINVRSTVFDMKEGEVSDVFRSVVGWHIMKIVSKHQISDEDLAGLKEKLSLQIRKQKAREVFQADIKRANDLISSGGSYAEVRDIFKNPTEGELKQFDMHGRTTDGSYPYIAFPINVEAISTLAFSSLPNTPSHFVNLGDNYFSIVVTDVVPSRARTFEESKSLLLKNWENSIKLSKMQELASSLVAGLKLNPDTLDLSGVSFLRNQKITREEFSYEKSDNKYPSLLVDLIFGMKVGDVSNAVMGSDEDKMYIAVLKEIKTQEVDEKAFQSFLEHFLNNGLISLKEQLFSYLVAKYKVKVNNGLLERV